MVKALAFQVILAVVAMLVGAAMSGLTGAVSAALGGLACITPTALFVWVLKRWEGRGAAARGMVFLVGEFAKLLLVFLILALVAWLYPGAKWGAVVMGVIITLQANFLVFLVKP